MAASVTVPELSDSLNSRPLVPRQGVLTLSGCGIVVRVDRGHLILDDGIGPERQHARFARIGHGLRRLVVIGNDGMISLAALRWLHDQKAAFVMVERDGTLLTATGPVGLKDGRLRRAQALAHGNGAAISIARALVGQKLDAQARVARERLSAPTIADSIQSERTQLTSLDTIDALRWAEARAALAYWSAWHDVPVRFPTSALARVPGHWRVFGARRSPLTGSPRLSVNPPNAMLNYLYAILESESRIAAVTVGLDPNLGMLHADTDARASLACDLMEAVRPQVDGYVLDWLTRTPLRREWFFELRDGSCRLMAPFARQLAETAPIWARAVAPVAERVADMLWTTTRQTKRALDRRPTVLTQQHRRAAKGKTEPRADRPPTVTRVCAGCGAILSGKHQHCADCARALLPRAFKRAMTIGRTRAHSTQAQAQRSQTQQAHNQARRAWRPSDHPSWLSPKFYAERIQPQLSTLTTTEISAALEICDSYSAQVKSGQRTPHPRHWLTLARIAGVSETRARSTNIRVKAC